MIKFIEFLGRLVVRAKGLDKKAEQLKGFFS